VAPLRLLFAIDIGQLLPAAVFHDEGDAEVSDFRSCGVRLDPCIVLAESSQTRQHIHAVLGVEGMWVRYPVFVLLAVFAWVEPSFAQYSARCVYFCTHVRTGDLLGFNMCFHNSPVCTGHPFDAVARGQRGIGPAAFGSAPATAAERAACRADFGKFCRDVVPGGGRGWACLAARKNELPACHQKVARRGL
jgi:hypothetical protein